MILLSFFAVKLKLVPVNGMVTPGINYATYFSYLWDLAKHVIIPMLSYSLAIFGSYFLIMRSSMIDVFSEDFVLTARAKGLPRRKVITRHVVPNALLPITTIVVTSIALMFTGTFSIEILFSWPGVGRLMVEAVTRQDYPVMQAINYLIAVAVVAANFIVDILYSYLDPRVRVE
jgi:peptide/nickel transport system permease protein